jgi:hypothetical protein
MNDSASEPITLDWVRKISIGSLMKLNQEQLAVLQLQADKELFRAQLTKDWVDSAVRFKLWEQSEGLDHE